MEPTPFNQELRMSRTRLLTRRAWLIICPGLALAAGLFAYRLAPTTAADAPRASALRLGRRRRRQAQARPVLHQVVGLPAQRHHPQETPDELAYAEQILTDLGKEHGFDVTCLQGRRGCSPPRISPSTTPSPSTPPAT